MKRSEMVELIASVHADWQMLTANETMSFPDVEFAEFLLTNIENAGMLPPQTSKPIHHYNQDALQCLTEAYHKWEREDEEK